MSSQISLCASSANEHVFECVFCYCVAMNVYLKLLDCAFKLPMDFLALCYLVILVLEKKKPVGYF